MVLIPNYIILSLCLLILFLLGVYVEGLTEYSVNSVKACQALLNRGERNRVTRQTRVNLNSSRSHSVLQLMIESNSEDKNGMLKKAKLNF